MKYKDLLGTSFAVVKGFTFDDFFCDTNSTYEFGETKSFNEKKFIDYVSNSSSVLSEIDVHKIPSPNNKAYGTSFKYNDSFLILLSDELNPCWTRFTIVKELVHISLNLEDKHSYNHTEILTQMESLCQYRFLEFEGTEINKKDENEYLAFLVSVKLFFSNDEDHNITIFKIFVNQGVITWYDIAKLYKVPEKILKFYVKYMHKESIEYFDLLEEE